MNTNLRLLGGVIVPAVFAFACSSNGDTKSSGGAGGSDASASASGGAAGSAGGASSAGTGNNGGAAGSGGGATGASGGAGNSGGTTGNNGGASGSGGAAVTGCDTTACEGKTFGGMALTACCMTPTTCGVTVGGAQCFSPSRIPSGDGGVVGTPETVVLDPTCPDNQFQQRAGGAITLAGCCDKTGVCGVSTANFPSFGGIKIATMCATAADTAQLTRGRGGAVDAGPQIACTYKAP